MIVASDAISATNAELAEARLRNLPILSRSAFLNALAKEVQTIFVAGSHGKSSTTAMIAKVLDNSGMSPSFYIGARLQRSADGVDVVLEFALAVDEETA
jgi:UDP-N-acetylmuramate--alanine ligase